MFAALLVSLGLGITELEIDPGLTVEKKSPSRGYTRLPWLVKSASFEDNSTPPLANPIGCHPVRLLTFQDPLSVHVPFFSSKKQRRGRKCAEWQLNQAILPSVARPAN